MLITEEFSIRLSEAKENRIVLSGIGSRYFYHYIISLFSQYCFTGVGSSGAKQIALFRNRRLYVWLHVTLPSKLALIAFQTGLMQAIMSTPWKRWVPQIFGQYQFEVVLKPRIGLENHQKAGIFKDL